MRRKGRDSSWLGERWSELEDVPESGTCKAVLAGSSSPLHTLLLQEPSGYHSPCSGAGLWHNVHWCVLARRHGASQPSSSAPWPFTATGAVAMGGTLPDPLPGRGLPQVLEHPGARWGCTSSSWKAMG